jgi:hypothetical protein
VLIAEYSLGGWANRDCDTHHKVAFIFLVTSVIVNCSVLLHTYCAYFRRNSSILHGGDPIPEK